MRNFKYILSAFVIIFIVSCAQEDTAVSGDTGPIYKGPYYNEFLACNAGPAFDDGIQEMLSAWQELPSAAGLGWAGVYAPVGEDHRFSNGWWELEWDSKESSDNAFSNPSPEFLAWSEKSEILFALAVIFDDIAAAFATVAFVAFISLLIDRTYTATQYALLASIGTAGRTTLASSSGALVDWLNGDWGIFFILTALMVIPSLIILWIMKNKLKLSEK